eukprot:172905-Chlamydomonas_euryale.AAC.2
MLGIWYLCLLAQNALVTCGRVAAHTAVGSRGSAAREQRLGNGGGGRRRGEERSQTRAVPQVNGNMEAGPKVWGAAQCISPEVLRTAHSLSQKSGGAAHSLSTKPVELRIRCGRAYKV